MSKERAKRIRCGCYLYRGFVINCIGYYEPDHKTVWEAVDESGGGFAHSYSLREAKKEIDYELDKGK